MRNILIIDDEKDILNMLSRILELEGYQIFKADSAEEGRKIFKKENIYVVIIDMKLPDAKGIDLVKEFKEHRPESEIICFTAYGRIQDGVQAMKNGAFDYLVKGDDNKKIIPLISKAIEKADLQFKILKLQSQVQQKFGFEKVIGSSTAILKAVALAKKVSPLNTTVLITGPTGTGKEVFARAIHSESDRASENFMAINCSALGKDLLESELFGHKAGAFTGATKDKPGLLEEAHKGTVFLDEIGEMDLELQAKILRFLQEGTFISLGDTREKKVDVRVISATNRNLQEGIDKGVFREDLFYRLSVFSIHLPALDERKGDIKILADFFAKEFALKMQKKRILLAPEFIAALEQHSWRGNIRELRNVIERAVILCESEELTTELLPFDFLLNKNTGISTGTFKLKDIEKAHIQNVLIYANGNKTKAAEFLDIGLTTLYNKLKEYQL